MKKRFLLKGFALSVVIMGLSFIAANALNVNKDYLSMSKDEIVKISITELADLPLEDIMKISDKFSMNE